MLKFLKLNNYVSYHYYQLIPQDLHTHLLGYHQTHSVDQIENSQVGVYCHEMMNMQLHSRSELLNDIMVLS